MAALDVFRQIAKVADIEFLAADALPTLWHFALGPLLNLQQFQLFMTLIKGISSRIEQEQTRKLEGLSSNSRASGNYGAQTSVNGGAEDFESLVTGRKHISNGSVDTADSGWGDESKQRPGSRQTATTRQANAAPAQFAWSTPSAPAATPQNRSSAMAAAAQTSRTVTPDVSMGSFAPLTPAAATNQSSNHIAQPLQPQTRASNPTSAWQPPPPPAANKPSIDWSAAATPANAWSSTTRPSNEWGTPQISSQYVSQAQAQNTWAAQSSLSNQFSAVTIAPPPTSQGNTWDALKPQGSSTSYGTGAGGFGQTQKQGLDKYDSLL